MGIEGGELVENVVCGFRPNEGSRVLVVVFEEVVDGLGEFTHASENAPSDSSVGDLAKETLYQVEPRRRGRDEVSMETRMTFEPPFDLTMFVG